MTFAMITRIMNSLVTFHMTFIDEAPRTFRIPISLVLCSTRYDANPSRPRQEKTTAVIPMMFRKFASLLIIPKSLSKYSVMVMQSKGRSGIKPCHCSLKNLYRDGNLLEEENLTSITLRSSGSKYNTAGGISNPISSNRKSFTIPTTLPV